MLNTTWEWWFPSPFSGDGQLNPEYISATSELWDQKLKNVIGLIVQVLNSIAWDIKPDLLTNTNQAQLFGELCNYQASFNLISNGCSLLSYEVDDKTKGILKSIQVLHHYLEILLKYDAILYHGTNVSLLSIDARRAAVFFLIQDEHTICFQQIDRLRAFLREKGVSAMII